MKIFSIFVESIRRLYRNNKITKEKVVELYEGKKITEEELNYILDVKTIDKGL